MAGLIKRGKTYYALYYIGEKQKRVSLRTTSYQIAKAKLAEIETSLNQGEQSPLPTQTPLDEALRRFIKHLQVHKNDGTVMRDLSVLRQAFGQCIEELELKSKLPRKQRKPKRPVPPIQATYLEQITPAHIASLIDTSVRVKKLTPRTGNRYREVLSRLFSWSMRQGGVKMPNNINPVLQIERYHQKTPQIRFLRIDQIHKQLKVLEDYPQIQAMVALYIYAGLRREEALWLQIEDINFRTGEFGMLKVQAKQVNGEYWQPKTRVNRAIPISSTLRSYLDCYSPRPSVGGWYFPSPNGSRYDCRNFSKALFNINKAHDLDWSCLDFRHTFGSQLAMKGESLYKISKLMGNSPDICRTHYAALIPEELSDSVEFDKRAVYLKGVRSMG